VGRAWAKPEFKERLGNYPVLARTTAKAIPGCELLLIPHVGHLPQVQAFDTYFAALTKFLKP